MQAGSMSKSKTKPKTRKVWKIFRFQERFELPDNIRFSKLKPLVYIRDYVGSGQDDEAINYKRQIMACKSSPNRHKLLSVFSDLREIAANRSKYYRGYILDERFEPASYNKIASWVGLGLSEGGKILGELERIGLIERVPVPIFEPPGAGDDDNKKGKKAKSRAQTRKVGKTRKPLKRKDKAKTVSGSGKDKKNEENNKTTDTDKGRTSKKEKRSTAVSAKGQEGHSPTNPKESDGGVGNHNQGGHATPPLQSLSHRHRGHPEQLGDVLHQLYDPEASAFAEAVYKAIGTPYPRKSKEGVSELSCFKQAWAAAQLAGIAPSYLKGLWARTMKEAAALAAKRRRKSVKFRKSPEAVLRWLFDKLLADAVGRASMVESKQAVGFK